MSGSIAMNVFRQDAFSGVYLTEQVNRVPFVPTLLGDMNIFEPLPIMTTDLQIDAKQSILSLIETTPRGAPLKQRTTEKRAARYFPCPRLGEADTIYASELQNVRSENQDQFLKDLGEEVAIRLSGPSGLVNQVEYTKEYHRLGAIQGVLMDADGTTVINNWYNEFGIAMPAEIGFNLTPNAGTQPSGYVRGLCNQVVRSMRRAGQGAFIQGRTEVHALAGDVFFDQFINHPDVTNTYQFFSAASDLRQGRAFDDFTFGGITWHNYRGSDDNTTIAIPPTKAKFFPVKAPGVFKMAMAPGEGFGDVNKKGKPIYVYRDIDPSEEQAWVRYKVKAFLLHICTRPEMLLSARSTA